MSEIKKFFEQYAEIEYATGEQTEFNEKLDNLIQKEARTMYGDFENNLMLISEVLLRSASKIILSDKGYEEPTK